MRAAAEQARTTWGATDFVVNSAGAFLVGPLAEVSAAAVRGLFDVNVVGTTLVTQALLPALREAHGSIVNVASAVALTATPGNAHYAASKAAVAHLTRCWALELGPAGIRVNAVAPGPTATAIYRSAGMSAEQEAVLLRERAATIPLRRLGEASETARWITRFALEDDLDHRGGAARRRRHVAVTPSHPTRRALLSRASGGPATGHLPPAGKAPGRSELGCLTLVTVGCRQEWVLRVGYMNSTLPKYNWPTTPHSMRCSPWWIAAAGWIRRSG